LEGVAKLSGGSVHKHLLTFFLFKTMYCILIKIKIKFYRKIY